MTLPTAKCSQGSQLLYQQVATVSRTAGCCYAFRLNQSVTTANMCYGRCSRRSAPLPYGTSRQRTRPQVKVKTCISEGSSHKCSLPEADGSLLKSSCQILATLYSTKFGEIAWIYSTFWFKMHFVSFDIWPRFCLASLCLSMYYKNVGLLATYLEIFYRKGADCRCTCKAFSLWSSKQPSETSIITM